MTIYNENPDGALMFRYPRYVIKGGEVVVEEGDIRKVVEGREFVVQPAYDEKIEDFLRPLFQQYYTMSFENYPVELERDRARPETPCRACSPPSDAHDHPHPQRTARPSRWRPRSSRPT